MAKLKAPIARQVRNGLSGEHDDHIGPAEQCKNCDQSIETMAFKGTGVCSVNCQKAIHGDTLIPKTAGT